jgi:3-phosphoshikimate 1-carboxyvinyltransferase
MQRALACAALAEGESLIRSPSRSADCLAALAAAAALGARVEDRGEVVAISGIPLSERLRRAERRLSCGESGLCMRMFAPIAALFEGETELLAEGTLRKRSVSMAEAPLAALGAFCESAEGGLPPLRVRGRMLGGRASVDGRSSSQLLTGLLVSLPLAERDSLLEVEGLASKGYVDLTLDTMRAFGVEAERDAAFREFHVRGGQAYRPTNFIVEGDWSGAAFLLVAAAVAGSASLSLEGLDTSSAQPDRAILEALRSCGASFEERADAIAVGPGRLKSFAFDATERPDLFPPLAVLALACAGTSELKGVSRLRGKESDRAAALAEELGALGARIEVEGDLMLVRGLGPGGRLAGGSVSSREDHRVAMAAAVASLLCESPVEIAGSECVSKSWPSFFEDLARVAS